MPKAAQNFPTIEQVCDESGEDLQVCQCLACGLVQLSNKPVDYYKEVIRAAAFSEDMRSFRLEQFRDFVHAYSLQNKKVIEIGCGKGEFLSLMKDTGTDAYGIEYADDSVKHCKENGLQVSKFYIEDKSDQLPYGPFDCFFIMNFFEHLPDPNATLQSLHSNLKDDGIGIIEVPNFDMILENNLFSEFINDHLFYFTKDTLKLTLERNGFEVIQCDEVWHNYIISVVVRKRKKVNLSSFQEHQTRIQKEIQNYISKYDPGKIVIYGAGHQSLAVISLTQISDSIKCVIDDATFKQGKYTPATHLPIVSNECLKTDAIDAIIVMAASYSDEVANKIKSNFNNDIDMAILRDFGLEIVQRG